VLHFMARLSQPGAAADSSSGNSPQHQLYEGPNSEAEQVTRFVQSSVWICTDHDLDPVLVMLHSLLLLLPLLLPQVPQQRQHLVHVRPGGARLPDGSPDPAGLGRPGTRRAAEAAAGTLAQHLPSGSNTLYLRGTGTPKHIPGNVLCCCLCCLK